MLAAGADRHCTTLLLRWRNLEAALVRNASNTTTATATATATATTTTTTTTTTDNHNNDSNRE